MKIFDVSKFKVIGDGKTLLTKKVQALINKLPKGGVLYFPKGKYVLSTLFLKSDMSIKLAKGAYILGAKSFYDYAPEEKYPFPLYQDSSHSNFNCSLFVGKHLKNITFFGEGTIDMRSVWDLDNVRDIVHRGPKCITLFKCNNVVIKDLTILNATDLAVYFTACNNVTCDHLYLDVYIDGISPDNSKNVLIQNSHIISGDDGIVFKSSYNQNKLDTCEHVVVKNCKIKSRCNAIKFGTESNGGFKHFKISDIAIYDTRMTGISVETVDGAHIDDLSFKNITMKNTGTPLFVHIGDRLRGPKGTKIGSIKNVHFENIKATGPYKLYKCKAWNYVSYVAKDHIQFPGVTSKDKVRPTGTWQVTSNICGLKGHTIKNVSLKNIYFELDGGVKEFSREVPAKPQEYPEVHTYGTLLPAYGIYFRHVDKPKLTNIKIKLLHQDKRERFIFD